MYLVTHHPIIWKRYMRRLQVPLTQLRPTFKFSEKSSNYEIEFLVTRACALDRSWRRNFPKVEKLRVLTTQYKIIDLKFLPGGKFLVASAKDRLNYRFYILVYALDVMYGSRLLARLPTYFKVYDLQARYMDYGNRPGIMISYTRRRFKYGVPPGLVVSSVTFYNQFLTFFLLGSMFLISAIAHLSMSLIPYVTNHSLCTWIWRTSRRRFGQVSIHGVTGRSTWK